ncbi:MAG: hypothetical protein AVDCRST_MAG34-1097 [uncultured Nocardioidaceae bacterium]|uniref:Uncharacterized protein n=1 Tax=uncultured Nocardioidaceae bacterium TaxID=253824 RepID=A0A6J4LXL5_9ACTN|nr:MAG: hypothetical protein AVDCRST_MAG34-1097 [uncultured Nocardioidaceae bacterium]
MTYVGPSASRRAVLLGSAVAGLGGLSGCTGEKSSGSGARPSTAPEEAAIFDLSFRIVDRFRPVELVAPGFEVDLAGEPVGAGRLHRSQQPLRAPFAAVEVRVTAAPASDGGAGTSADVAAGLATADDDHVLVRWSGAAGRLSLEVRRAGRTRVLRRRTVDLSGSFGLAFALCENQVTALVDTGDGWRPVLTERAKVAELVDLRNEQELSGYSYAWGVTGAEVAEARAGVFGMTGLRDPHLVQHADGTPYEREGRIYLTWTCAGLGFFQQAHWTVWSLDPAAPQDMRLEAQLFTRREGLVLGDHAGQVIRDGDRWLVATSSWGDFAPGSIHVRHCETTEDVLSGVHLLETEPTPLPTEHGTWDPAITRLEDIWYVGFVESPSQEPFDFHPALASSKATTWSDDLSGVAAATDLHQCEGPILTTVDDDTYLLASDGNERSYPVFDLTGRRIGRLDAPYPTNLPHPNLIPDPAGGWLLVTFEGSQFHEAVMGYGGHGDVIVMHSV